MYESGMRIRSIYGILRINYYKVSGWIEQKYGNFNNRRWSRADKDKLNLLIR